MNSSFELVDEYHSYLEKKITYVLSTKPAQDFSTVAINDLLCMKNAGAQIAIDFS